VHEVFCFTKFCMGGSQDRSPLIFFYKPKGGPLRFFEKSEKFSILRFWCQNVRYVMGFRNVKKFSKNFERGGDSTPLNVWSHMYMYVVYTILKPVCLIIQL